MITPDIEREHVRIFCSDISGGNLPRILQLAPHPKASFHRCVQNVETIVSIYGGKALSGWHISEWPGLYLEARSHDVWECHEGKIIDPTPTTMRFLATAFVEDVRVKELNGHTSRIKILVDDDLVYDFIGEGDLLNNEFSRTGVFPHHRQHRIKELLKKMIQKYGEEPFDS